MAKNRSNPDNNLQYPKAVFFDIDGTLVSFKTNSIPQSTIDAIHYLKKKGIKIIVATGRSINTISHVRHIEFDGFICFNGGYCFTPDGNMLHRQAIDQRDIISLLEYSRNIPLSFALMYENDVSVNDVSPEVAGMYAHLNLPVPREIERAHTDTFRVLQANIFLGPADEDKFMRDIMPNSVATRWTPLFADVNASGLSKLVGVEIFCRHFGINISDTMSFGDGGNDSTMLIGTGIGVAMGNANAAVKEIADYVTDNVDNDGILKALQHYGIIN